MKLSKLFLFIILSAILTSNILAQKPKKKPTKKPKTNQTQTVSVKDNFKVLALGDYSKVDSPFIFVARNDETYKLLQNLVENLPSVDFTQNAAVAVFGGTKGSSGFTVSVKQNSDGKISAQVNFPPKDSMTAMALSQPYKVVLVPIEDDKPLQFNLTDNWQKESKNYQVSNSKFNLSGGFAGISEDFEVVGNIQVMTFGGYSTFLFNLNGKGENKTKILKEISSGTIKKGNINLPRLDAGTFADNPKSLLKVYGNLDKILSLKFEPMPSKVADGFNVRGNLEAKL